MEKDFKILKLEIDNSGKAEFRHKGKSFYIKKSKKGYKIRPLFNWFVRSILFIILFILSINILNGAIIFLGGNILNRIDPYEIQKPFQDFDKEFYFDVIVETLKKYWYVFLIFYILVSRFFYVKVSYYLMKKIYYLEKVELLSNLEYDKKRLIKNRISNPIADLIYTILGICLIGISAASFLTILPYSMTIIVGCIFLGAVFILASFQNSSRRKKAKENSKKFNADDLIKKYKNN